MTLTKQYKNPLLTRNAISSETSRIGRLLSAVYRR